VVLEDLQYLRVDPSIFPQYNNVTELCPLVKAWCHERTRRNRSGIHVVAGMRPNKIAKGIHSVRSAQASRSAAIRHHQQQQHQYRLSHQDARETEPRQEEDAR
jgi:hypothetical protein